MKLLEAIEKIPDPRMEGKVKHKLSSIIFMTLCAVLSGCECWNDIEDYCKTKKEWLSKHVNLKSGIPSEWTFRRLFTILDPKIIESLLRNNAKEIINKGKKVEQIAIDGKAIRGSKRSKSACLQSVSAWCNENNIVLAEEAVEQKSNEIKAIPILLESLTIRGSTISIDAAGCQKDIVKKIREKGGHYVLGLKRNHPKLYKSVLAHIAKKGALNADRLHDKFDDNHGRLVRRRYFGYNLSKLSEVLDWEGAKSIVAVETISSKNNDPNEKVSAEWRYYLSSHHHKNDKLPSYIRNHWGIENKLHWVLDVHLKEDDNQKAERKSVRSFAILKRIALNVVRSHDPHSKRSLRGILKRSGWSNDYLLSLLLLRSINIEV